MSHVTLESKESFEAGLRRFNKRVQQHGILTESRRRKYFEKPSVRRKKKQAASALAKRRTRSNQSGECSKFGIRVLIRDFLIWQLDANSTITSEHRNVHCRLLELRQRICSRITPITPIRVNIYDSRSLRM